MTRLLYLDCYSGASGDMILGALLDVGVSFDGLTEVVASLGLSGVTVERSSVNRSGISATKFSVVDGASGSSKVGNGHTHSHEHHHHDHRGLSEITSIIERSSLPATSRDRAVTLFRRLAEIEAEIHQMPVEQVHLHEVGAVDSIVDIVGSVYALDALGIDRIVASPLNVGSGTVKCEHGELPVPAPATAELLVGTPIYAAGPAVELLTPTGALLLTDYVDEFGSLPPMRIEKIGYGAGDHDFKHRPNVLRALVGVPSGKVGSQTVVVLECEIDDMNPQIYGVLMDRLMDAGALDVFYAPIQMKKNRPGTLVTVVSSPDKRESLVGLLFAESTTIGLRITETSRECLDRDIVRVQSPVGSIRVKVARRHGVIVNVSPEFDDCVRIADERGCGVKDIQAIAMKAWLDQSETD